jgi:hypothetical protein
MNIERLINQPCTIIRRSASEVEDELGDEVAGTQEVAAVCALQQRSRAEDSDQLSTSSYLAAFRADEDIDTDDALVVEGVHYEFAGEPHVVFNPRRQQVSHIEATMERIGTSAEAGS